MRTCWSMASRLNIASDRQMRLLSLPGVLLSMQEWFCLAGRSASNIIKV